MHCYFRRDNEEWTLKYEAGDSNQGEAVQKNEGTEETVEIVQENEGTENTAEETGTEKASGTEETEKWLVNGKEVDKESFTGFLLRMRQRNSPGKAQRSA